MKLHITIGLIISIYTTIPTIAAERDNTLCLETIKKSMKDPYSMKVESGPIDFTYSSYQNKKYRGISYEINAKNSYGGYVGTQTYACVFNELDILIASGDAKELREGVLMWEHVIEPKLNKK